MIGTYILPLYQYTLPWKYFNVLFLITPCKISFKPSILSCQSLLAHIVEIVPLSEQFSNKATRSSITLS